jgi:hypothetical protein
MARNDNPRYYVITEQSRFHMKVEELKNIEDATDEFFTREEMMEMTGSNNYFYAGIILKKEVITTALEELKAKIVKSGKKTGLIDDHELSEFFLENPDCPLSQFVEGLRRSGTRVTVMSAKKERTSPNKKDVVSLINLGTRTATWLYGRTEKQRAEPSSYYVTTLDIKYAVFNYLGALTMIQKLVTLEQILAYINMDDSTNPHSQFYKEIWDNPAVYCAEKP